MKAPILLFMAFFLLMTVSCEKELWKEEGTDITRGLMDSLDNDTTKQDSGVLIIRITGPEPPTPANIEF